ncbi:MAG: ATP-binding protein [Thermomicrobiales bacterium]|nr:ATP-binding protein [Thermomicrobiales bacterium]
MLTTQHDAIGLAGSNGTGPNAPALPASLQHLAAFSGYFDLHTGAIGRVVGSEREPAGSHAFYIWADESARDLDVGHIVIATSEEAVVIGVVDEPRRFTDLRSFLDDFFDRSLDLGLDADAPTKRPEILVFKVNVLATRHIRDDVDSHRPPISGPVYFATEAAIEYALDRPNFTGTPIPALLHTNGNAKRDAAGNEVRDEAGNVVFQRAPIWLDEDYLLGPEAGHANWTGQSGLATKTSHAIFLTSAVFQRMKAEGKSVAALMFNVKGPDLLWLDKPAEPDSGMEEAYAAADCDPLSAEDRAAYAALGVRAEPFEQLRIFAPFKPTQQPQEDIVNLGSMQYHARLNTLRNARAETQCVYPILWTLEPLLKMPHKIFEHSDLDDKLFGLVDDLKERVATLRELEKQFADIFASFEIEDESGKKPEVWNGHHKFTIRKAHNRFKNLASKFGGLVAEGSVSFGNLPGYDDPFADQEVRVIDIAHCNTNVQELLVTRLIDSVWHRADQEKLGVDKVIIFVDELNTYAAAGSQGGLRDTLVDIAARGRHLNVVLFGAQQFRSKVDDEILGNCGTSFYGRVGDEEIINYSYRSLSDTAKAELLGLRKGRLLVRHAHFRTPLFGSFPKPPTIKGMGGQRVFNEGAAGGRGDTHPGDGLFFLMRRLMPENPPSKAEVRTAADGYPAEVLDRICRQVEQETERKRGTTADRISPWNRAKAALSTMHYLKQ